MTDNIINDKDYNANDKTTKYKIINEVKDLDLLIKKIYEIGFFSIDTETDSIKAVEANLIGISLSCEEKIAYYLPINHTKLEKYKQSIEN